MPVLREARTSQPSAPTGGVVRLGQDETRAWGVAAAAAADFAGQLGRMMAETTQDEAVALAAAVELDETYQPIFRGGDVQRARMGDLAGRAFDAQILPRQASALQSDLAMTIDRLRDAHQYDLEGFKGSVAAAIDGMAGAIPPELRAVFQDGARRQVEQTASRIGWNEGQLIRSNSAEQFAVNAKRVEDEVWLLSQAGRFEEAQALSADLEAQAADLEARRVIGPSDAERARRGVNAGRGMGELMGTVDLEALTGPQIRAVQEQLVLGTNPELNAMFRSEDERVYAATRLSGLASQREAQARAAVEAQEEAYETSLVLAGAAEATNPNRARLDAAIGGVVGYVPTPVDWVSGKLPQAVVWDSIRQAGMLPASLQQSFNMAARGALGPEGAEAAFGLWVAVSKGRSPDGAPISLAAEIPEAANARFGLTELYLANGFGDFATAYERAGEAIANPPDRAVLADRLNAQRPWMFPSDTRSGFTAENLDERVGAALGAKLAADLEAPLSTGDRGAASRLFLTLIADQSLPADEAYGLVRRSFEARLTPTDYMALPGQGVQTRSAFAPEKHYALPSETLAGRVRDAVTGARTWFDTWAENQIRTRADADLVLPEGPITSGKDGQYRLIADPRSTGRPVYRVEWRSPEGFWEPLYDRMGARLILDAADDHKAAVAPRQAAADAEIQADLDAARTENQETDR